MPSRKSRTNPQYQQRQRQRQRQPPQPQQPGLSEDEDGVVWLQYYADYQYNSNNNQPPRGDADLDSDDDNDNELDAVDDGTTTTSSSSAVEPLLYRVPPSIAALPDESSVRIQEAMNSLLEETLDDVERLLTELERLGGSDGVDLESEEFEFEFEEEDEDEEDEAEQEENEEEDDDDYLGGNGRAARNVLDTGGAAEDATSVQSSASESASAAASRSKNRSNNATLHASVMKDSRKRPIVRSKKKPYEMWARDVEFAGYDDNEAEGWAINREELDALISLFGEVKGPPDLQSDSRWLDRDHHYCSWGGVVCAVSPPLSSSDRTENHSRGRSDGDDEDDENGAGPPPPAMVIRIDLPRSRLAGSVPKSAARLQHLQVLNLANNQLRGTIPAAEYANLTHTTLRVLDLSHNRLTGSIPLWQMLWRDETNPHESVDSLPAGNSSVLEELHLSFNHFTGSLVSMPPAKAMMSATTAANPRSVKTKITASTLVPQKPTLTSATPPLRWLDLSTNRLTGPLPDVLLSRLSNLEVLLLGDNFFAGGTDDDHSFPCLRNLSLLEVLDIGANLFDANATSLVESLPDSVTHLNAGDNLLTGTIPADLWRLSHLEILLLSDNQMTGPLPTTATMDLESETVQDQHQRAEMMASGDAAEMDPQEKISYDALQDLRMWFLARNKLQGSLPPDLFVGLQASLEALDISYNAFSSNIPTEIGLLTNLYHVDAMGNQLTGSLPDEMLNMNRNLRLNFTGNLLTGTIPDMFCGEGLASSSMLYQEFGCDAVLCRPGTFSIYGHATLHSACRPCPTEDDGSANATDGTAIGRPPPSKILGRTSCDGVEFVHGDLDGDGELSSREILRMIYIDNLGRFWGPDYQTWADMSVSECKLTGVVCMMGQIVKVDLGSANLCSDGDRKPAPTIFCKGLPREIGQLTTLEFLHLARQKFLRGTIPTEIGQLTRLQMLDLTNCASIVSTLPTEIGRLTNLHTLKISHTQLYGTIPSELFNLPLLEVLHLTNNRFSGKLAPIKLPNIRELMLARNDLSGTLPNQLSALDKLENFEAYHNRLSGTLPARIGDCAMLKRIDLFSNKLSGMLPTSLLRMESLQILHLKDNLLTGTIPELGRNPLLSWVDLSDNYLHGPIPASFGTSRVIEDLRLGHNMLHDPIPPGLCSNTRLNGGTSHSSQQGGSSSSSTFSKSSSGARDQHGVGSCDHVICPIGTYSEAGHATESSPCHKCPPGQTTLYLGSPKHSCHVMTPERIMSILFEVMRGEAWPLPFQENWGDESVPVCQWAGLTCDENDELTALAYPLRGFDDY